MRSVCRHRHLPGDGPHEARQFAGDRGGDNVGRLAGAGELAIARAQPQLPLPGDVADQPGLLPQQQLAAEPGRETVTPCRLDQQPAGGGVPGFGSCSKDKVPVALDAFIPGFGGNQKSRRSQSITGETMSTQSRKKRERKERKGRLARRGYI